MKKKTQVHTVYEAGCLCFACQDRWGKEWVAMMAKLRAGQAGIA